MGREKKLLWGERSDGCIERRLVRECGGGEKESHLR